MELEEINIFLQQFPSYNVDQFLDDLSNSKFSFRLEEMQVKDLLTPAFHWYNTQVTDQNGFSIYGTGEHYNQSIARIKSIGEAVERYCLKHSSSCVWTRYSSEFRDIEYRQNLLNTSNGVAFHTDPNEAFERSFLELIERDSILNAWLYRKNSIVINPVFNKHLIISKMNAYLKKVKVTFLLLPNPYNIPVVSCAIQGIHKGDPNFLFGYGAHTSLDKAIEKSFYEAWRFYMGFKLVKKKGEANQDNNKFVDHFFHYMTYENSLESVFSITEKRKKDFFDETTLSCAIKQVSKLQVNVLDCSCFGVKGYIIHSYSDELVNLWSGPLSKNVGRRLKGEYHPIA